MMPYKVALNSPVHLEDVLQAVGRGILGQHALQQLLQRSHCVFVQRLHRLNRGCDHI